MLILVLKHKDSQRNKMRSLYDAIFGSNDQAYQDIMDTRTQGLANQAFNIASSQYAQQVGMNNAQSQLAQQAYTQSLLGQYNMYRDTPKWVFNGKECTLKEFTEFMFPDDDEARLMFILKHGGV